MIHCSFSDISDDELVSASQLLLDECVSAKRLCVWGGGMMLQMTPPQIRAPSTDRQIVTE